MAEASAQERFEVLCPHCKKPFEGELMIAAAPPWTRGFKCPHCRLFVPFERADGEPREAPAD